MWCERLLEIARGASELAAFLRCPGKGLVQLAVQRRSIAEC